MSDDYIVYCLYTEFGGVFYVGCGRRKSRLKHTVKECERNPRSTCMKCRYILACQARGIKIHVWVISSCSDKQRAEEMEYALIQMYPHALTNSALNWHPMKQFPNFLQESQEPLEVAGRARRQRLRDSGGSLFNEEAESAQLSVSPEHFRQAVDAILAYNDAVAQPSLRWYISVLVVCDLLGGQPSKEKSYLVKKYLASRRDELEVHHQRHGLTESHNRKLVSITERVKVEPAVVYEPYTERFRRAVDAILVYNNVVAQSSLRWYINEEVVHDLLGGQSSGIKTHYLIARYLTSRRDELEAHHQRHGLTPEHNDKRSNNHKLIYITEWVKVEPAVAGESDTERFRRATDAILTYNDTVSRPSQRWYISAAVVHDLLGGRSSGILRYLVEQYLASRRHELEAHHQKHGLEPSHSRKLRLITECVKIELKVAGELSVEG